MWDNYNMHPEAMDWFARHATRDGAVLDVGGRNINGTPRDYFSADYTTLDIRPDPGVDIVADAATWEPPRQWPVVVCAEVLEHAERWREIVATCAAALAPGGRLILTCAGPGRALHSGVDGGDTLHDGEHYGNVDPADLHAELKAAGLERIVVDQTGTDVRAVAFAP